MPQTKDGFAEDATVFALRRTCAIAILEQA